MQQLLLHPIRAAAPAAAPAGAAAVAAAVAAPLQQATRFPARLAQLLVEVAPLPGMAAVAMAVAAPAAVWVALGA